ncbi:OFA family MFS transporter [Cyanobium sp. ATX 6A2]|uniref:L-lactate MFS transporter n=1 Tax=Cyanobium sp. ATX 6A2 TaxID=2823700 RepID=UPI0020CE8536|nr:OFA family MFS transporter [Cyanobium sp. ATX 6A2]MCP9886381.1 OFA family MFS transporter [Cyanobium sp. ATX 6A2]
MGPLLSPAGSLDGFQPHPLRLFGLPAARGRWLLLPLGAVAHLCMGTVYAWSVFRQPLEQALGLGATQSLLPYTVALLCYALVMPVGGQLLPRLGPRRLMLLGAVVIALGYLLASRSQTIGQLVLTYGVIVGSGVGLAYGVPLAVAARWFPERQGLAIGLVVVGFGLSPLITAPLAHRLIVSQGLGVTLQLLGVAFLVFMVVVALAMALPPPGWRPPISPHRPNSAAHAAGQAPASAVAAGSPPQASPTAALLRSRSFWGLWLCYSLGALLGLSAIGISSQVGLEVIAIDPALAASSISLFAVFNGASRPLFGWLSDRLRPSRVATLAYLLVLVGSLMMARAGEGDLLTYLVAFSLFWASLGAWLAIAPAATLRCFDPERYAQTYGLVFTAYGAGALLGTLITGQLRDWLGSYSGAFLPMAAVASVGIVLAHVLLRPGR